MQITQYLWGSYQSYINLYRLGSIKTATFPTTKMSIFEQIVLMSKVRFNLRPNNTKNPLIQLVYRINGDSKKLVIGTKLNVPEEFWNKRTMRVRETRTFPDYNLYNTILDRWENATNIAIKKYAIESITPSKIQLRNDILSLMRGKKTSRDTPSFTEYFNQYIKKRKLTKVTSGTIRVYENALYHIESSGHNDSMEQHLSFKI